MSDTKPPAHHFRPESALAQLPGENGADWRVLFEHGTFELEIYAPRGHDPQEPHERDEIYVVISGTGTFVNGPEKTSFKPGDLMFVPAGTVHRFEDFSEDFATWVIFYGPAGGE